jgi:precorrin-6B methylase 2
MPPLNAVTTGAARRYLSKMTTGKHKVRDRIKHLLEGYAPTLFYLIQATKRRAWLRQRYGSKQNDAARRLFSSGTISVLSGPFKGMLYINDLVWGPIQPKWIGSYEYQLHDTLAMILSKAYPTIIDVGAAEGYYAVGLAWKLPNARVYSYDVDPWARAQQRRLAKLNGVRNLKVLGKCSTKQLQSRISDHALIVCDVEGDEYELLDPKSVNKLGGCDILVEIHTWKNLSIPSVAAVIASRFENTHRIYKYLSSQPLTCHAKFDLRISGLSETEIIAYMDEDRGDEQIWLWLEKI